MNHERLSSARKDTKGIAFAEAVLMSSPSSRSQMCAGAKHQDFIESGFGGWADEKIKTVREAAPMLRSKKSHPQHLTISRIPSESPFEFISSTPTLYWHRKLYSIRVLFIRHSLFGKARRKRRCFFCPALRANAPAVIPYSRRTSRCRNFCKFERDPTAFSRLRTGLSRQARKIRPYEHSRPKKEKKQSFSLTGTYSNCNFAIQRQRDDCIP